MPSIVETRAIINYLIDYFNENNVNELTLSVSNKNLLKLESFEATLPREITKEKKMSLLIVVMMKTGH